jgi:hypothetical protein
VFVKLYLSKTTTTNNNNNNRYNTLATMKINIISKNASIVGLVLLRRIRLSLKESRSFSQTPQTNVRVAGRIRQ